MPFIKGHTKSTGRPKGSSNKNSANLKNSITEILSDNVNEFKRRLQLLSDRDFVDAYLKMGRYVIPTLKAQEMDVNIQSFQVPQWLEDLTEEDEQRITNSLN